MEILDLNYMLDQMGFTDIRRMFCPTAEYYSSQVHVKKLSRISNVRPQNKFKNIQIISSIFSKHNGMELEIN